MSALIQSKNYCQSLSKTDTTTRCYQDQLKRAERRRGMNLAQCRAISQMEDLEDDRFELRFYLYLTKFSHEFDWIYDGLEDKELRSKGSNPKGEDYRDMIDNYRSQFGLEPLNDAGLPQSKNAWLVCDQGAKDILDYDHQINSMNQVMATESRNIFERDCQCIANGIMQKAPIEVDCFSAIDYYQSNCTCGLILNDDK